MEFKRFEQILSDQIKEIGMKLNQGQAEKFYNYMGLLVEWNGKMNLTAITEPEEVITKHFVDSLTIQGCIEENGSVVDVGTGAGFPGIPLKIMREDVEVTLLDSLNKRIVFLEEMINKLELEKTRGIHGRAEELGRNNEYREKYNVAVSRAVAPLNSLLEYMSPFVIRGGKLICMKGPKLEEELASSEKAIRILGLEIEKIEKSILPNTQIERNVLVLKKVRDISEKYPRKVVNIKKDPL